MAESDTPSDSGISNFTLDGSAEQVLELLCDPDECTADTLEQFAALVKLEREAEDDDTPTHLGVREFVELLDTVPCLDVRAPSEYAKGHLPHALNLPLFTDEERAKVGTRFKQNGRSNAMQWGMSVVRPKLSTMQHAAQQLVKEYHATKTTSADNSDNSDNSDKRVLVHCWRGGMRSHAIAWLLRHHTPLQPILLVGGYKAYRTWAQSLYGPVPDGKKAVPADVVAAMAELALQGPSPPIVIVGGRTGCGKTRVLLALKEQGQQVVDLEGLACHKGSSFGWVDNPPQPTPTQFENDVAYVWRQFDATKPVYVEDEGPNIGSVSTPRGLYQRMRTAPVVVRLLSCMPQRVGILVQDYYSPEARANTPEYDVRMRAAIRGLQKKLGPERVAALLHALDNDDGHLVAQGLLEYYDSRYDRHIQNAGGTGSGGGQRSSCMLDVSTLATAEPDELADEPEFDDKLIAERIVLAVEQFFAQGPSAS